MMVPQLFQPGTLLVKILLVVCLLIGSSRAYKFHVGGKDGWVLKPSEDYNHWAERNRFQVNDTLYFKYKKGSDSVLVVNKDDYYSCNTQNPKQTLSDGNSTFTLDHSGPFFFISGNTTRCQKGQRLITVVLAVRHKTAPPPRPPSPPHAAPSPPTKSPSPAPAPPPGGRGTADAPAPSPAKSGSQSVLLPGSVFGLALLGACMVVGVL